MDGRGAMRVVDRLLPASRSAPLRAAVVVFAAACAGFAVMLCIDAVAGGDMFQSIAALGLVTLAIGVWRLREAARLMAVMTLWAFVLVMILGTVNPFAASDMPDPPPVPELLLFCVAPYVLPALVLLHLLGRYRKEFR